MLLKFIKNIFSDTMNKVALLLRCAHNSGIGCGRRSAASLTKKLMPIQKDEAYVESDTEMLSKYACVNYLVEVEGPGPKIRPDSKYPDWLFQLDLRPKRVLEDMDPEVDGWHYWLAYKERQEAELKRFEELKYRYIYLQRSPSMKKNRRYSKYVYL